VRRHASAANAASNRSRTRGRRTSLLLVPVLAALLAMLLASSADAASFERPFTETFGSAAQPTFGWNSAIAIDHKTGDIYIGDANTTGSGFFGTLQRFHPDGTPAPFEALGSNVIDGREANGKPCAEEPASCDKTPQGEIVVPTFVSSTQIAIDESGGPADGDIYLTQVEARVVDIFAPNGRYLGQITGAGQAEFQEIGEPCGVAVDSTGTVYIANYGITGEIQKYVPTTNTLSNGDLVQTFKPFNSGEGMCDLKLGTGSSDGLIFGSYSYQSSGKIYVLDQQTGALKFTFGGTGEANQISREGIAVDPKTGTILIPGAEGNELLEFEVQNGSKAVKVARIVPNEIVSGFAVNSSDEVLMGEGPRSPFVSVYGAPGIVPEVSSEPASNVTGTAAGLSGIVNPTGLEVTECFFEYGETAQYGNKVECTELPPTDSEPHRVRADISGLEPNGHQYHFRLVAVNANGREESTDRTFVTANTVVTEVAAPVGTTTATLNGTVRPEADEYSECFFEWGPASSRNFEGIAPCEPGPTGIGSDLLPHAVKAPLSGLQPSTEYRYRLVATNALGTLRGEELTFDTNGVPRVAETVARNADEKSVTIEATINPSGFGTSYHFEWGPTTAYGNDVPTDFEPFIGSGTEPVLVKAKITGLSEGTTYHYRVVATNSQGTTASADQEMETLDRCGLPDGRCFELASPRDAGPIAIPGKPNYNLELISQAAAQPGTLAYVVESGLPGATRGAEVLYRGVRGPSEWSSTQISPPILQRDENLNVQSETARTLGLSADDSCGVMESTQPLTADASMKALVEAGGKNLYRLNPDGSYTGITKPTPVNFDAENFEPEEETGLFYEFWGASRNCGKIVFSSVYQFPGVAGKGLARLYEWDEGVLSNVGVVPGPSGETVVAAVAGGGRANAELGSANAVSENGSRVFFSAERQTSPNPEEVGKTAIFVRENGRVTRDVSLSETATPDEGARFEYATADGSRVFFSANAGLTPQSSSEGTDLYEYNLETGKLSDLSVEPAAGGSGVTGLLGTSADGSHIYFAAQGQLIPGKGSSAAKNRQNSTASIYSEDGNDLRFVGTMQIGSSEDLVRNFAYWTSRVSSDGRYLLFESTVNLSRYDSKGLPEVYLFDSQAGSDPTVCVSCRHDGEPPSRTNNGKAMLASPQEMNLRSPYGVPRSLVVNGGKPEVFFTSPENLASGPTGGRFSVYEWVHGQVFRVVNEPAGLQAATAELEHHVDFLGADEDGSDLYVQTPETLTWEDGDHRPSVYDARIGGGFPQPPPSAQPCNPVLEGSCSGSGAPQPAAVPGAASSNFVGPGNPTPKQQKQKGKKKPKKHKKKKKNNAKSKKHKKKSGKGKAGKNGRDAKGNRRAGK
jgi:hypothetical protein